MAKRSLPSPGSTEDETQQEVVSIFQEEEANLLSFVHEQHAALMTMLSQSLSRLQNMHSDEPPRALEEIQDELYLQEQAAIKIQALHRGVVARKDLVETRVRTASLEKCRIRQPILPEDVDPFPPVFCKRSDDPSTLNVGSETSNASSSRGQSTTNSTRRSSVGNVTATRVFESIMDATVLERRERWVGRLDYVGAALVLANSVVMLLELELEGQDIGKTLGQSDGFSSDLILDVLHVLDTIFAFAFLGEWLIRLVLMKCEFWKEMANWFDTALVFAGLADVVVAWALADGDATSRSLTMLRMMRVLKSMRAIRMVRSFRFFRGLRVLVKACQCFLPSLCWSMVLLGLLMSMGSLFLGNLLQDPIADEAMTLEDRQWLWSRYGTAYRSTYTLFEITFAGNWPISARPVLEKVSHAFVAFFVIYITVVVFAMLRVISAVFLKDTLDAAQNDAEQLVMDKMRTQSEYIQKLEEIFRAISCSKSSMITEARLIEIFQNPKVAAYFQTLDLDVQESRALFHVLDNGDGEISLDEFIDGVMRCKGPARAIDQVAMHADMRQIDMKLSMLMRSIDGTNKAAEEE
ncbi:Scn11a, partial [Symbiodinium sp. KB8]